MYVIMGVTGNVGGAVAESLLAQGVKIRAILRNPEKAAPWRARDVEIAIADYDDADALTQAFTGAEGVFIMIPPNFAPTPGYVEALRTVDAVHIALERARPKKAVYLSSIGAEQPHSVGLITSLHQLEQRVADLPIAHAFIRAAWFMENFAGNVAGAREQGKSFFHLNPLDRKFPMVATPDIGAAAAKALLEQWTGTRVIEVAGPSDYSPQQVASAFAAALGHPVEAIAVPREQWAASLHAIGIPEGRTEPFTEMLDNFNNGWIHFGVPGAERSTGKIELTDAIRKLVAS